MRIKYACILQLSPHFPKFFANWHRMRVTTSSLSCPWAGGGGSRRKVERQEVLGEQREKVLFPFRMFADE